MSTQLPCPTCLEHGKRNMIFIEPELLLSGAHFSCPVCHSSVALAVSSYPVYRQGLDKYHQYQMVTGGLKTEGEHPKLNRR
ncbi:hypothetical protein [Vibrio mangrovi]|uniref:Uncharacterized protein n=1 Tax=Vibrio mangrovi TaxID=474394 RepID=A0A1Y6ISV5_9VIBR|nr:hypothetical protein [Vibrio mangrovi]MDW6001862.1 hypothetical protein [Vibrio mangrovi]SMS00111.1 hypothetical protein VIM7927_01352 [Vibrio mangrovi]